MNTRLASDGGIKNGQYAVPAWDAIADYMCDSGKFQSMHGEACLIFKKQLIYKWTQVDW